MSGLFCDACGYERPGCQCDDPFFHKHAMELKAARAEIKQVACRVWMLFKPNTACMGPEYWNSFFEEWWFREIVKKEPT